MGKANLVAFNSGESLIVGIGGWSKNIVLGFLYVIRGKGLDSLQVDTRFPYTVIKGKNEAESFIKVFDKIIKEYQERVALENEYLANIESSMIYLKKSHFKISVKRSIIKNIAHGYAYVFYKRESIGTTHCLFGFIEERYRYIVLKINKGPFRMNRYTVALGISPDIIEILLPKEFKSHSVITTKDKKEVGDLLTHNYNEIKNVVDSLKEQISLKQDMRKMLVNGINCNDFEVSIG